MAKTAIAVVVRDRAIMLERVAPEAIDRVIVIAPANALVTVAATVRTAQLIADRAQRQTMRPPPKAPQRSEWPTASNGRVRIALIVTTRIAANAGRPTRIAQTAIVGANTAQASGRTSLVRANVGQVNTGTANIAPVSIGVNIAAIIGQPVKAMHTGLIAVMHRPDVIVTKPEPKASMRRRSRITVAAAKAVPHGAAPMRRSS